MSLQNKIWKTYGQPLNNFMAKRPGWQLKASCFAMAALAVFIQSRDGVPPTVLYAVPISILAWYVGSASAFLLSTFSILASVAEIYYRSAHPNEKMVFFTELTRFSFFAFLSIVIPAVHYLQRNLESLANERGLALASEVAARQRLEHEMLESSERKQRGIGWDLHDGLSQHLIATAMASYAHAQRLSTDGLPQAESAHKIVQLIEQAIALSRAISESLHPIEMSGNDLMSALEKFAATTSDLFSVECRFECHIPVIVEAPSTAAHLYRIVQEGVSNAIRHGQATKIEVFLGETDTGIQLSISDNGVGFSDPLPDRKGIGLEIMAARSKFIGGEFSLHRKNAGGMELVCQVPAL